MGSGHFESDNSSVSVGVELDTPLSKVRERETGTKLHCFFINNLVALI